MRSQMMRRQALWGIRARTDPFCAEIRTPPLIEPEAHQDRPQTAAVSSQDPNGDPSFMMPADTSGKAPGPASQTPFHV
jgi:hypothetical protein